MPLHSLPAASASPPARLRRLVLALALLGLSFLGHAASASTRTVPGLYPTIQAAINASVDGDVVLISDGTYTGPGNVDVDFVGKIITVTSVNGPAKTIVDCGGHSSGDGSGNHRGFTLHSAEAGAVIRGLTIQNGYEEGNGSAGAGGGIKALGAAVTVQNCVLLNNTAQFYGGGLYVNFMATLTGCILVGNTAGYGGGLYSDGATVTLTGCTLTGNTAQAGGGFLNNGTTYDFKGWATLTDCTITGNTAYGTGGGVYNNGTPTLTNCTLTGNTAQTGGGFFTNGRAVTLTNDILTGDVGGEISDQSSGSPLAATFCDIQGGYAGTGNIAADPLFVSAATGDLHVPPASPCAGVGTPNGAPAADKDGKTRPNPPSIGAYEPNRTLTVPAQYLTIQAAINAAYPDDTVLISDGTYTGPGNVDLDFGGKTLTVTSAHGAATTIIDCQGSHSADHRGFRLHSGETNAVISGLTVKNGYERGSGSDGNGGGVEVLGASATIQNCVLTADMATASGGGLYNNGGTVTLTDCAFTGDTAGAYGGGLYNNGTMTLTNCTLTGASAVLGGGLLNGGGGATLTNCTLTGNTADTGGGLFIGGKVSLTNDILYGDAGGEVYNGGTASAIHCDVGEALGSGGDGVTDGGGNLSADPLFVSGDAPFDLFLARGSPCAGAGTPNSAPAADKDGHPRHNPPSIGAYEPAGLLTVPGQYPTIQAAINASLNGDTVLISDGTYTGPGDVDLDLGGKNLTVASVNGPAKTIIDCQGGISADHRGFRLHSGETNAVISGLTVKNGYERGSGSDGQGGGLEVLGVGVTVLNCVLLNDTAQYGGGLFNNGYGGTGSAVLTDCTLEGDTAGFYGGGLFNGGTGSAALTDCVLVGDTAGFYGGGLYNDGLVGLTNCTLTGSTAPHEAGGLYNDIEGTATLTNDILYTDTGGDLYNGGTASVTNCDVGIALGGGGLTGGGNIAAIPQFVSPSDLHLLANSPCLGAGTSSGAPTTTLDGYPQPDPPSIGAYELDPRTTTALTSSLNPSASGQSVTFTATVTGSSPTGTVTFTLDGTAQAPVTLDGSGSAALTASTLPVGSHSITAAYGGDTNNNASTSGALTQAVNPVSTTTALTSSLNPSVSGQPVTFTATLSGNYPSGTVTFTVDGVAKASAGVGSGDIASFTTSALKAGTHTLTASYNGDASNAASTSPTLTQTVTLAAFATNLVVAAPSGAPGQTVTLKALLRRTADGTAVSGETVAFTVDGTPVGAAVTDGLGFARLAYAIPAGDAVGSSRPISASFGGDGTYSASSGVKTLTITQSATNLVVAASSGAPGQTVTFKALLRQTVGSTAVAGETITFTLDGASVGTAVTDGTGFARLAYAIPAGDAVGSAHPLSVSFGGDGTYSASSGAKTLTISEYGTSLAVAASSGASGQTVTLKALLRRKADGTAISGKMVAFTVDGTPVGAAVTDGTGFAVLPYAIPAGAALGSHPITASFAEDGTYAASMGQGTLTVKSVTALSVPDVSGTYLASVKLSAFLTAGGSAAPGRTVTFLVDGTAVGTAVTDATGTASLPYTLTARSRPGKHKLSVFFAGDAGDVSATGAGTLTVS